MGYSRVDTEDDVVAVWKPFCRDAEPPRLLRLDRVPGEGSETEAEPPCCNRIIHLGYVGGVFLDGTPYRPYQLIGDSEDLRAEIIRLHERKQQGERT
jgi:hypothetical protein